MRIILERDHAQHEVAELQDRLRAFETQYHMSSDEFYQRYEHGELGDSADCMEWSSFYDMSQLCSTYDRIPGS